MLAEVKTKAHIIENVGMSEKIIRKCVNIIILFFWSDKK